MVLHLPRTKVADNKGEDIYWASQKGDTDPTMALIQHLHINQPSVTLHLFAYKVLNTHCTLTKTKFLEKVAKAVCMASLEPLQGHGIRIGLMLKYLLRELQIQINNRTLQNHAHSCTLGGPATHCNFTSDPRTSIFD